MPTYTVKPGDSILKISRNTGVPADTIRDLNNIKNNRIFANQKLSLPYIYTPEEQIKRFISKEITPEERALLSAIGETEGTKGYGTIFGSTEVPGIEKGDYTIKEIIDMSLSKKYPDGTDVGYGTFTDDQGNVLKSGATGRYQLMGQTLSDLLNYTVGIPGLQSEKFTPALQDQLALALIRKSVKPEDLQGGLTEELVNKLSGTFASFPKAGGGSQYSGQKAKDAQKIIDSYNRALGVYKPQPINTSTSRWIVG